MILAEDHMDRRTVRLQSEYDVLTIIITTGIWIWSALKKFV